MVIHDLTVGIRDGMPVWPGDPTVAVRRTSSIEAGDMANVTHLSLGSHSGTHVDAPVHFVANGQSLDAIPLETYLGTATVVECVSEEHITSADLESLLIPESCQRLLIKTSNSRRGVMTGEAFYPTFRALTPSAAEWLVARDLRLVGVDGPSVEPYDAMDGTVHRSLLGASMLLIEGLDLSKVLPGQYELICLPLKVLGADGAPARVLLIER